MKKFRATFNKETTGYVGVTVGDKRKAEDGTRIIVTSIISVVIEDELVIIEGYGMEFDY